MNSPEWHSGKRMKQAMFSTLKELTFCVASIHQMANLIKLLRSFICVAGFHLRVTPEVIHMELLRS